MTTAEATGFLLVFRWFVGNWPFPMARHCHKNHPWEGNLSSPCREAGPGPILPPAGDRPGPHPSPSQGPQPPLPALDTNTEGTFLAEEHTRLRSPARPPTRRVTAREPGRAAGSPRGCPRPHARGCVHSRGKQDNRIQRTVSDHRELWPRPDTVQNTR